MQIQMELDMRGTARAERVVADAEALVALLRSRPQLQRQPAGRIAAEIGWADRRLRAAAEASAGAILSAPGCIGYRLAESTAVEDYYQVERARYRSQIREMEARLVAMDRAVHGRAKR